MKLNYFLIQLYNSSEKEIQNFLTQLIIIGLEEEIKKTTIQLRKNHRLKLLDAIIAATAFTLNAEILTNDTKFSKTPKLKYRHLKLKG
jgi:predicted nucleic acid-binding protein